MTCCDTPTLVVTRPSVQWVDAQLVSDRTLSDGTVEFGFAAPGSAPGSWQPGTWTSVRNRATVLLDSTGLAAGPHDVWVRVTDSPEQAVIRAGALVIR